MGEYQAGGTFVKRNDTKLWGELYADWLACKCVEGKGGVDRQNERKVRIVWTGHRWKCLKREQNVTAHLTAEDYHRPKVTIDIKVIKRSNRPIDHEQKVIAIFIRTKIPL